MRRQTFRVCVLLGVLSTSLLGCLGSPSLEVLKHSMAPTTREMATTAEEAFACLRLNIFDGQWVHSVDQRTFVVGNTNRPGNFNAIAELSPVGTAASTLTVWHEPWIGGIWRRLDQRILERCQGVRRSTER